MVRQTGNEYEPDHVSPPGETLRDVLDSLRMTQASLARRMGRPVKTINEIVKAKTGITPDTALQLEKVLGVPAHFWNARERHYREFLAEAEERKRMRRSLGWLRTIPVHEMTKLGWIEKRREKEDQFLELLKFYGVAGPEQWERIWGARCSTLRRSRAFKSYIGALSAWLRQGEIEAQAIVTQDFNSRSFRTALSGIRALTRKPIDTFVPEMIELCAQSGVALTFVPPIKGTRAYGATRWLTPRKALIELSLRGKTDDHLWFTFFHEAAHILKHGKRRAFIEGLEEHNAQEEEADAFAADFLIPRAEYNEFLEEGVFTKSAIGCFAREVGIAPGIVVGRLQHDKHLDYSRYNNLKVRYRWTSQ